MTTTFLGKQLILVIFSQQDATISVSAVHFWSTGIEFGVQLSFYGFFDEVNCVYSLVGFGGFVNNLQLFGANNIVTTSSYWLGDNVVMVLLLAPT